MLPLEKLVGELCKGKKSSRFVNHVKCINILHSRNVLLIIEPAGILTTSLSLVRIQVSFVVGGCWQNCHP